MPDITSKSSAYQNGFGVHFNDWQASDCYKMLTQELSLDKNQK